jgi:hypothetical protein
MKTAQYGICSALLLLSSLPLLHAQDASADDSTGVPGDHFSLQGALEMFKKASSPEEFEKLINTQDNNVNNLDLNGDGETDYIRVVGKMEKDAHVFALQVPVSEKESQDIAVIELEKTGDETAVVQIVGDEDIFGEQTIVEPSEGADDDAVDDAGGKGQPHFAASAGYVMPPVVVINVWGWPCVRFVYAPAYTVWVSPWRWRTYPGWWRPWRPVAWRVFHPFRARYRTGYVVVHTHRVVRAHRVYTPVRTTSTVVRSRHGASVKHYRVTRTTVKTRPGGTKVKTTRTTRVRKGR